MSEGTLFTIRLQVALHNYVSVENPRKLFTKLETIFTSYFLPARW